MKFSTMLYKYKIRERIFRYLLWVATKRGNKEDIMFYTLRIVICHKLIITLCTAKIKVINKLHNQQQYKIPVISKHYLRRNTTETERGYGNAEYNNGTSM